MVEKIRGPRCFDPRNRFGRVFVDLVKLGQSKLHLQVLVKLDRKGVLGFLVGRMDLDSLEGVFMPSGALGEGIVDVRERTITFKVTEEMVVAGNVVNNSTKKTSRVFAGKGVATVSYVSFEAGRIDIFVGTKVSGCAGSLSLKKRAKMLD